MTREHKLSLILGFAAVVFVGLLVSDHFSKARASKVNPELSMRTPEPATIQPDANPEPMPQTGTLAATGSTPSPIPAVGTPEPVYITMHTPESADPAATPNSTVALNSGTALANTTGTPSPIPGFVYVPGGTTINPTINGTPTSPVNPPAPVLGGGLPVSPGKEVKHPVVQGETAFTLAKKYYGDGQLAGKLVEYNKSRLPANGTLRNGVTLRIPPKDVLLGKATLAPDAITSGTGTPSSTRGTTPMGGGTGSTVVTPAPRGNNTAAATTTGTYTVVKGDTLGVISQKTLGTSKRWKEILNLNRKAIDDPDSLVVGTVLKLPPKN
ncbi:MAG: LysM peptidoglycan-binding domain-containing protein [Phycisphaerales bacterium]